MALLIDNKMQESLNDAKRKQKNYMAHKKEDKSISSGTKANGRESQ